MLENIQKEEITLAFFSCGAACRHMRNGMTMEAVLYKVQFDFLKTTEQLHRPHWRQRKRTYVCFCPESLWESPKTLVNQMLTPPLFFIHAKLQLELWLETTKVQLFLLWSTIYVLVITLKKHRHLNAPVPYRDEANLSGRDTQSTRHRGHGCPSARAALQLMAVWGMCWRRRKLNWLWHTIQTTQRGHGCPSVGLNSSPLDREKVSFFF